MAAGDLTSEQLVETLLARIERLEPRLGAFVDVYGDDARAAAREADSARRAGSAAGRFHGVPVALKDIIYIQAQLERAAVKREYDAALAGVDALLTPAARTAVPVVADIDQSTTAAIFARLVNIIDYCALAAPSGMTAGGLPLSLKVVCRGHEEATALRVGQAYPQATDWHTRVPPWLDPVAG